VSVTPGRAALVIGGLGFIGANLCRALLRDGCAVRVVTPSVTRREAVARELEALGAEVWEGDVRDATLVARAVAGRDLVANMAGQSGAVRSMEDPWTDLDVNCRGNLVVLEAVRTVSPGAKVLFPGSRLQFGRARVLPVSESHPAEPLAVHGVHKLAAEHYHVLYHRIYGLRTTVFRITNPYGPGQPWDRSAYGIVNRFVQLAVAGETLTVFGDGRQQRDYLFVDDLIDALLLAVQRPATDGRVYNLGSGSGTALADVARLLVEIAGTGSVRFGRWPALAERIETGDFVADVTAYRRDTGWSPRTPLKEGIARTVESYRKPA
jgi:UDP-glucose 4-epimerase